MGMKNIYKKGGYKMNSKALENILIPEDSIAIEGLSEKTKGNISIY